ncbi:hypothetical protein HAX54_039344, partial [Datura stramonium]|nr:hypothetical protein [Datura stramonium]
GPCPQGRYDVRKDQIEVVRAVSSYNSYIMIHSPTKAPDPITAVTLSIVEPRLGIQLQ